MPLSNLPVVLLRPIFKHLADDPRCLPAMTRVSHLFLAEAEPLFYRHLAVSEIQAARFCTTLIEVPRLANHIQHLVIRVPSQEHTFGAERFNLDQLAQTLRALANLRTLEILSSYWDSPTAWPYRLDTWILHECTFDLVRFTSAFAITDDLLGFLEKQPHIVDWSSLDGDPIRLTTSFPDHVLPDLTHLRTTGPLLKSMCDVSRPITHMRLDLYALGYHTEQATLHAIKAFGSLMSLAVTRTQARDYCSPGKLVSIIASVSPNLQFLALFDTAYPEQNDRRRAYAAITSRLTKLETFIWESEMGRGNDDNSSDWHCPPRTSNRRYSDFKRLVAESVSFRRLILYDEGEWIEYYKHPVGTVMRKSSPGMGKDGWREAYASLNGTYIELRDDECPDVE